MYFKIMGTHKMHIKVYNYYLDNLINVKKLETKNILIDKKNYKHLVIYFTRYVHCKSIKILNLHYHKLIGKNEKREVKNV